MAVKFGEDSATLLPKPPAADPPAPNTKGVKELLDVFGRFGVKLKSLPAFELNGFIFAAAQLLLALMLLWPKLNVGSVLKLKPVGLVSWFSEEETVALLFVAPNTNPVFCGFGDADV